MPKNLEPSPPSDDRHRSNLTSLKVPPHSVEAEQAVLGGLMIDNTKWDLVADAILPEDFYRAEHQLIFRVMLQQTEVNSPIDVVTLVESLNSLNELGNAGGVDYLGELAGNARGTANIQAYTDIIRERAILRRLIAVANNIADSGYNTGGKKAAVVLDEAEQQVFNISDERPQDNGPVPIGPLIQKAVERIDELSETKGGITGLASGYKDLDKITSGWQKSDLVIVAGRPSMGKTAFAMNLVEHAILNEEKPVLVFSLEMPAQSLLFRMLSSVGRIDQTKLRTGDMTKEDWDSLTEALPKLKNRPLFIDDSSGVTPTEMRARARRIQRDHGPIGMIVVDYLQLMHIKGTNENRVNEISEISRSLKLLARDFECPVIALSQLNRGLEQRPNKRPQMSDLRESGAIEQDADLITFIYRDEVYNEDTVDKGIAEVIIGKHRNGELGTVRLSFLGKYVRFESHAKPRYDDSYTRE
ncbi:MAG: replicative DNA helicase [Gammaproteobacteria bacterium]|nr:replicative DNA helicase [Gammaproteobacteria bacterium]|tara:strand:- start:1470 stop:2882 length:1413 start_codon:yes stop_codon:yes gene_type:complete